ncbi:L,D-transpeptidase family protein [Frisingicoccus sp.]|uniref:L,D-transpeptidase family protein n=1 Tax=Frisingicoccus sp. TaxID=1918627 RepID=UPI003AB78C5C
MNKKRKVILGIAIGAVSLLLMIYVGLCVWFSHHFLPGTFVNGIDSSNKTAEDVTQMLTADMPEYSLTLTERDGSEEKLQGEDIGFYYDYPEVYQIQKKQNNFLWFIGIFTKDSYEVDWTGNYDGEKFEQTMQKLHCLTRSDIREPSNASIENTDNGPEVIPENEGNKVDSEKLRTALDTAIGSGADHLDLDGADCYLKPEVTLESPEIRASVEMIEKLSNMTVTYDFRYETEAVGPEEIRTWLVKKDDGTYEISRERVAAFVADLAGRHNTVWASRDFYSTTRGWITVEGGTYGWEIDQEGETEKLMADLASGQDVTREPVFFMDPYPGPKDGSDIGDTYVEIDLGAQHMWFYKNGSLVTDTDVTTGTMRTGHGTPAGVFYIENRLRNTKLIGEDYETEVSFWMQVYKGVGIHDATWRSAFGGDYYLTDGSHGCINTPYDIVEKIFNNIEVGTPVVMYY